MINPNKKVKKIIFLEKILRFFSILIIKRYHPRIIGITGSVGKTSSKEAIFSVLSGRYRTRKNEKNYNNEIGLPLTIIGSESGGDSVLKWAGVFLKALGILIFPIKYPKVLVLEMGADHPGDIKYLTAFIKCETAVVTDISGSHLENFKTIEKVGEEKWMLVNNLQKNALAIVNIDNPKILKMKNQSKRNDLRFLAFGFSESANIRAEEVFYNYTNEEEKNKICGLSFKLNYKGTSIPMRLNNILAEHSIYAALAGVAVGIEFGLNLVEIASGLENFSLPPSRMSLLSGIKNSSIIDDTYNSSPASTLSALEVLRNIEAPRKIIVLGDMLELGSSEKSGHLNVAKKSLEIGEIFLAVGERMKKALAEARKNKINAGEIFEFDDPVSAGNKLQEIIKAGDLILIKGSQGMRMEKIVEEIMSEPEKADEFLCRQNPEWKNKPWKKI